jgi:DNA polymerase III subunit alpha
MYIIFDTETTGLPKDFSAPITDFDNWPRIVQIAWKVYDENGKNISSHNRIIKPEGFRIPEESIRIHRISNERANHEGILLKDALQEFVNCINQSDYLIAHNISFDHKVTACEFLRLGWANYLNDIVNVCTMNSTIDFCGIKGKVGIKPPSLTELHQRLFNKKFEDAHDALVDVEALARCFFELRKLNVLGFSKNDVQLFNSKYSEEQILNKWKQRNGDIPKDVGMTIFGVHTYHSVLEGASSVSDYIKKAKEYGHSNLVLTDRANMSGGFTFFQKCKSESIKPIIGCEFYVTDLPSEDDVVKEKSTNVIQKIIIKDNSGFVNANRLNYLSFKKGFYRVPRISFDLISQNTDGVLLTTSSKQGYISKLLQMGKLDLAEQHIQYMLSLFGNKSYIAEIALEENYIQRQYNSFIINMSLKHNLALILSHDVYYSDKGGDINLDILNSINQKRSIEDSRTKDNRDMHYIGQYDVFHFNECFNYHYDDDFLKMCMITSDRVASTCNFEYEIGVEKYPEYKPTEDVVKYFGVSDTEGIIRKLSHAKLNQKLKKYQEVGPVVLTQELIEEYRKRLDYEIEVIKDKKMLDYFLVVWELIRYCGENDISIGPGRGSASGSLLSWCLDITKIDSIRFNLYFERFLNPERNCLTENCKVLLRDGSYKNVVDVEVGDPVQSEHGLGNLIQKHERELKEGEEVYEIETEEGVKVQLTGCHIVPVFREGKRIEIRVDEIRETDQLFVY